MERENERLRIDGQNKCAKNRRFQLRNHSPPYLAIPYTVRFFNFHRNRPATIQDYDATTVLATPRRTTGPYFASSVHRPTPNNNIGVRRRDRAAYSSVSVLLRSRALRSSGPRVVTGGYDCRSICNIFFVRLLP